MKTKINKFWLLIGMLWVSLSSSAYDFETDGIYYLANVASMTATVTRGDNLYEGDVVIPETTTYKGKEFKVTAVDSRAFKGSNTLVSLSLPESVITIGEEAFMGCAALTDIQLPNNITILPASCFSGCNRIEQIALPKTLTQINHHCFANCSSLNSLNLPEGITTIEEYAFSNCTKLSSINIPKGISILNTGLFQDCSSLCEIAVPNSIKEISENVFKGCSSIETITIPSSVENISNGVFYGCNKLRSVIIEDAEESLSIGYGYETESKAKKGLFYGLPIEIVYLGRDLEYPSDYYITHWYLDDVWSYVGCAPFQSCPIKKVTIGKNVSELKSCSFFNCQSLEEITIPSSLKKVGNCAFLCSGLKSLEIEDSMDYLSFDPSFTTTFNNCMLQKVKIGRNLIVDENGTNCEISYLYGSTFFPTTLKEVEIGNFVYEMSFLSMYGMDKYSDLEILKLGCGMTYIPWLGGNHKLNTLTLCSPNPYNIVSDCFSNSQYMDLKLIIPEGSLDNYKASEEFSKFWDITEEEGLLANVIIDNNLIFAKIEDDNNLGLINSRSLTGDVVIPEEVFHEGVSFKVTSVNYGFKGCEIKSIVLPESVTSLPNDCFMNCHDLESVKLGSNLKMMGKGVFAYCDKLNSIDLPDSLTEIPDYAFTNCEAIKTLLIPDKVEKIGWGAFNSCKIEYLKFEDSDIPLHIPSLPRNGIQSLYIGRNLEPMEADWMYGLYDPFYEVNSLKQIEISENVTRIGSYSNSSKDHVGFGGCNNIILVKVKATNPPIGSNFSSSVYNNATLMIPYGTLETYRSADGWTKFKNIIYDLSGVEEMKKCTTDFEITSSFDGVSYLGEFPAKVMVVSMEGVIQYSGIISKGQTVSLSRGMYIIKINNQSIKIKI